MSEGHPAPRSHPNVTCLFSIYFFICSFSMSGKCLASTRLWMASRDPQDGSPGLSSHLAIPLAEGQVDSNNTSIEKEPWCSRVNPRTSYKTHAEKKVTCRPHKWDQIRWDGMSTHWVISDWQVGAWGPPASSSPVMTKSQILENQNRITHHLWPWLQCQPALTRSFNACTSNQRKQQFNLIPGDTRT